VPFDTSEYFDVEPRLGSVPPRVAVPEVPRRKPSAPSDAWLHNLPEGGVRDVFRHLLAHGSINEAEATRLLGGPRQFRKFSRDLLDFMAVAPFRVRVAVSSGTKVYVRGEG